MRDITLKELLEAGCHFGHQTNRWNPKAESYIYGSREKVHIIDLVKTRDGLLKAAEYLKNLAKSGGSLLVVGTKRQAKLVVEEAVHRIRGNETKDTGSETQEKKQEDGNGKTGNFYFLLERWPGGLLTNFDVIKKNNLDAILRLREDINENRFVTKKERLLAQRELDKYTRVYGGLVGLTKLPDAIFFVDVKKDRGAVAEAVRTSVPIVAIVDTNVDPNPVAWQIPANDDAVGSIKIIVEYLSDAWIEGLAQKLKEKEEEVKS